MTRRRPRRIARALIAACILAEVAACGSLPVEPVEGGAPHIEARIAGSGAPPVIFESGLGEGLASWDKVAPVIAPETTVFVYDRPGLGRSTGAATPRDGEHVVEELRALLAERGLRPPYVLVGHSLGGLYMQLFARRHPGEVAGLVLVDSTHPRQFEGVGSLERRPLWVRAIVGVALTGTSKAELDAIGTTGSQVMAAPAFTGKPVVVLAAKTPSTHDELGRDIAEKRADLGRLYAGSEWQEVDSGHAIQKEQPEIVIDAIHKVLEAARRRLASAKARR
jgi:pimeloyl-ACP methyl ester carboxylesterase